MVKVVERMRALLDLPLHRLYRRVTSRATRSRREPRRIEHTASEPFKSKRTLFIDVAVISIDDAGTGIQRVVRALALTLARAQPVGWNIQFVAATRNRPYHPIKWPDGDEPARQSEHNVIPIRPQAGDVFLGLDYSLNQVRWHRSQIARFRRDGARIWFLVHDLLPAHRPEWFSRNTVLRYAIWLESIASLGDGFLCNSTQTEADLVSTLAQHGLQSDEYRTCVLPMGYDLSEAPHHAPKSRDCVSPWAHILSGKRFFLKVGTLEPRKGHADLLRAFEILWASGFDQLLVLVGRRGWQVDSLCAEITSHPELGRRLIWLDDVDDNALIQLFRASEGVIIASKAEGFGLPLIEALGHGKPVMARDIPVFRVHQTKGVWYFPADADAAMLAGRISSWRGAIEAGDVVVRPPDAGWLESVRTLLVAVTA